MIDVTDTSKIANYDSEVYEYVWSYKEWWNT